MYNLYFTYTSNAIFYQMSTSNIIKHVHPHPAKWPWAHIEHPATTTHRMPTLCQLKTSAEEVVLSVLNTGGLHALSLTLKCAESNLFAWLVLVWLWFTWRCYMEILCWHAVFAKTPLLDCWPRWARPANPTNTTWQRSGPHYLLCRIGGKPHWNRGRLGWSNTTPRQTEHPMAG